MSKIHAAAIATAAILSVANVPSAQAAPGDKLFIASNGVALSQFPSRSRLTTSVTVGVTTPGTSAKWTAKSADAWLTVTSGGSTGKPLTLTANPAGLSPDTLYTTTVTVRTTSASAFQDTEKIRVGFWIGASDLGTVTVSHAARAVAANPVEPLVYLSDGGAAISVFNVYSGAQVATFPRVAPTVGQMAISSDGSKLFAVDTTNYRVIEVDAKTGKQIQRFQLTGPLAANFNIAYARPAGAETLFAAGQGAIDVATGATVSAPITGGFGGFYDPLLTATPDGLGLAVVERGLSPGSIYTWKVTPAAGSLTITPVKSGVYISGSNCQAMAMSADGTRLYPACGAPYEFDVYDAATGQQVQTLPGVPYPNNAAIDSDGNFVGGADGIYEANDIFVYNRKGYLVGAVPTATYSGGQADNLLATSGDSTRVITATSPYFSSEQVLMFRNLP